MGIDMNFPGATTEWKTVPEVSTGEYVQPNALAAESESIQVANSIVELRQNADALAALALRYINECRAFSADITGVSYVPPTFAGAQLVNVDTGWYWPTVGTFAQPIFATPDFSEASIIGEFTTSEDIVRPPLTPIALPFVPEDTDPQATPIEPTDQPIDVPVAPNYIGPAINPVPLPPPLEGSPVFNNLPAPVLLESISFPVVDDTTVTEAFAALEAVVRKQPVIPTYVSPVPSTFRVIGALLVGPPQYVLDAINSALARRTMIDGRESSFLQTVYSRRGLTAVDSSAYIGKEKTRRAYQALQYSIVTTALAADDSIRDAYKAGVAANSEAIELLIAVTDSELDALFAIAEAQAELWNAAVSSYQGVAATFENKAQAYTLRFTEEEARVQSYQTEMSTLKVRASFDTATARYFASMEQGKALTADTDSLLVDIEKAKVQAFTASNRAVVARADAIGIMFDEYQGEVAKWTGSLAAVTASWKVASSRAKAIAVTNQAVAQQVTASGENNLIVAAEAQKLAAEVAFQAEKLKADISRRSSAFALTEAANQIVGAEVQNTSTIYSTGLTRLTARVTAESANIEGKAVEAAAASRFFSQAAEAAGRAATLTQQANIQLAEAYATAQETSGKAAAAIEAGRFGGYSAHVSLGATAQLGATEHVERSIHTTYAVTTAESDSYQQTLSLTS